MVGRILQKLSGDDKNFPLIEIMVVLAAVGILVTIAMQKLLAH
jgi:prepilin-type N-terminal cleavage/methylation domain-containing protein